MRPGADARGLCRRAGCILDNPRAVALKTPTYTKHRERHEKEGIFTLKAKPGVGICMVKGCRRDVGRQKFSLCHCHYQHRWRMLNKKRSAYAALRDHARSRGIEFNLSYDYFLGMTDCAAFWCPPPENFGDHVSIDRIDPRKGYIQSNIRVVSVSENCRKAARERYLPNIVQEYLNRKRARAEAKMMEFVEKDDCPF